MRNETFCRILAMALLLAPGAWAQIWTQQLLDDRAAANDLFESGQLLDGATRLIEGLRALPGNDPAVVDPAAGNMQLLIFANEEPESNYGPWAFRSKVSRVWKD